jgi:putative transcriptional regulator
MLRLELAPLLEKRGKSYYWLTKAARINPSVMTRMKQHAIKAVTLDVLERICDALECEPGELFVRVSDKKTKGRK